METPKRKPPTKRHPTPGESKKKKSAGIEETAQSAEITDDHVSADHVGAASPGASTCDNSTSQSEETETIAALLERTASLEMKASYFEEKLAQVESEAALLDRQFSIEKMKDDDAAILFYTGFPGISQLLYLHCTQTSQNAILERGQKIKGKPALPG